jgi:hypothetical protein
VYISAKAKPNEIEVLYHRGELSPTLYQLHWNLKRQLNQSMLSTNSPKGNQLGDFLYQEKSFTTFQQTHFLTFPSSFPPPPTSSTRMPSAGRDAEVENVEVDSSSFIFTLQKMTSTSSTGSNNSTSQSHQNFTAGQHTVNPTLLLEKEKVREMLHFNQMILTKILDYFVGYIRSQPKMKSMILKMATNSLRSSSSSALAHLQHLAEADTPKSEDDPAEDEEENGKNSKKGSEKKTEKKKSKVGLLFYLFFLETVHRLLFHLPRISSSVTFGQRISFQEQKIEKIYFYSISCYNINNYFGKLIRFLFQQIFFYLCSNNDEFVSLQQQVEELQKEDQSEPLPAETELVNITKRKKYFHMKRLVDDVTHMDIILNILPFLTFHDIYQCLFLIFPSTAMTFLQPDVSQQPSFSNNTSASSSSTSSLFRNSEDLKKFIKYLNHGINQNKNYFHIANDIYDIFSYHINWEKFVKQFS